MTTFLIIRHGENDCLQRGILAGRTPGTHLNSAGRHQAEQLADWLQRRTVHRLFSSPIDRARETAEPAAAKLHLPLQILTGIQEVDFGDWTGKSFEELGKIEGWKKWNTFRSAGQVPNGESMLDVQTRVVAEIERLRRLYPEQTLALFSHGDPIRALITYYLGMPLDLLLRLEISSASVTEFEIDDWHVRFQRINYSPF
jgi:broad specificity phosphatase PhoE